MTSPIYNFEDKVVLISGVTGGGVGTALTNFFLSTNATVIANSKNSEELFRLWDKAIQNKTLIPLVGDVSNEEIFRNFSKDFFRVDIIINNAAHGSNFIETEKVKSSDWNTEIGTTLLGAFNMVRYFVPGMKERKYGKIVNISSTAANHGAYGRSLPYTVAKAGLLGFTKQLALELSSHRINVNSISPCQINTPRIFEGGRRDKDSVNKYAFENIPLGRTAHVEDIVNLVAFLSSDSSSFITGQNIVIDGGLSLSKKNYALNENYTGS